MASLVEHYSRVTVSDSTGIVMNRELPPVRFSPGSGTNGVRQSVTLPAATYTSLTVPAGAKALQIIPGAAVSLVLKGNTADVGVPLTPATNPIQDDIWITLGAAPTPGLLNNGSQAVIEVIWY